MSNSLLQLAEDQIPFDISYEEIQKAKNLRQTLHLRIFNNEFYLLHGLKGEERHWDILSQLFDIKDTGYFFPNTEFKYYTMDTVIRKDLKSDSAVFTIWDDPINGDLKKRILAPSVWFNGQNSGKFMDKSEFISYQDQIDSITDFASRKDMHFLKKENVLIFKGQVAMYPHREKIIKELIDKISSCSEFLVHARGKRVSFEGNTQYQNPMKLLSKYRYQLVTNGAPGKNNKRLSGTCRSMYMLATGGIVFYVNNKLPRNEWWQYSKEADGLIQYCDNTDQLVEKLSFFEKNLDYAAEISERGLSFSREFMHINNVREFWKCLLNVYSKKCKFQIEEPKGLLLNDKAHAKSLI